MSSEISLPTMFNTVFFKTIRRCHGTFKEDFLNVVSAAFNELNKNGAVSESESYEINPPKPVSQKGRESSNLVGQKDGERSLIWLKWDWMIRVVPNYMDYLIQRKACSDRAERVKNILTRGEDMCLRSRYDKEVCSDIEKIFYKERALYREALLVMGISVGVVASGSGLLINAFSPSKWLERCSGMGLVCVVLCICFLAMKRFFGDGFFSDEDERECFMRRLGTYKDQAKELLS